MLLRGFIYSLKQQCSKYHDCSTTSSDSSKTCFHCPILIGELMKFYEEYDKVNDFSEVVRNLDVHNKELNYGGTNLKNGLYLRALNDGIMEVGQLFVEGLCKLEKSIMFNEFAPEVAVIDPTYECGSSFYFVSKMHTTYYKIHQFINLVVENNLNGCQILDLCLKFRYSFPEEIFFILLKSLNRPLLKQITSWILFGVLEDPRDEFFIKHVDSLNPGMDEAQSTTTTTTTTTPLSSFPYHTSTSEMIEEIYEIDSSFMPCHVSFLLANKILNIGKLVSLLRQAPSETETLSPFQNEGLGINEMEIVKNMKDLETSDNCTLTKVEKSVNFVWNSVNKRLKKLAEEVGGMFSQHKMLMDVYLMQRGECMNNFVKYALHILKADAKKTSNLSLNLAFKNAINDSGSNLSTYADRLCFSLPCRNFVPDGTLCISALEVDYKKPWPLGFIFTVDVMKKYNAIFRYLLELKIAHLNLSQVRAESLGIAAELINRVLCIRMKLQQLLMNLESYIFDDVIMSENEVWEAAVKKSKTFNEIKLLHMNFLSNILRNIFFIHSEEENCETNKRKSLVERELASMIVKEKFEQIFALTSHFIEVLRSNDTQHLDCQLSNINSSLNDLVKNIIRIIHCAYKENDVPTSLIIRLNFNNFYSTL